MQHLDSLRRNRLISVTLDEASIGRGNPDQEHERAIAIYDLIEENSFALPGHAGGPYQLHIGLHEFEAGVQYPRRGGRADHRRTSCR